MRSKAVIAPHQTQSTGHFSAAVPIMGATKEAETDELSLLSLSHPWVILSLCNSLYCGLPHVSVSYFMISNLF